MKIYSDEAVTKPDVEAIGSTIYAVGIKADAIDARLDLEVMKLRWAIAISFALNLVLGVAAYFK